MAADRRGPGEAGYEGEVESYEKRGKEESEDGKYQWFGDQKASEEEAHAGLSRR